MKTIGIAAVSAEGAAACYKTIVRLAAEKLGPNMHPEVILDNPPFATILAAQNKGDWHAVGTLLADVINRMADAGAMVAVIPANSAHFAYDEIAQKSKIPVISIVEATVNECVERDYKKVAVLGVGLTMSGKLYDESLRKRGVASIELNEAQQKRLNDIIYSELVNGKVVDSSLKEMLGMLEGLKQKGVDAVLLACTELPMAITTDNAPLPFIDTTYLLAQEVIDASLS